MSTDGTATLVSSTSPTAASGEPQKVRYLFRWCGPAGLELQFDGAKESGSLEVSKKFGELG